MKIIIVDDDCLVAGALKTILEANPDIEVTATGSDGEDVYKRQGTNTPHRKHIPRDRIFAIPLNMLLFFTKRPIR